MVASWKDGSTSVSSPTSSKHSSVGALGLDAVWTSVGAGAGGFHTRHCVSEHIMPWTRCCFAALLLLWPLSEKLVEYFRARRLLSVLRFGNLAGAGLFRKAGSTSSGEQEDPGKSAGASRISGASGW